MPGFFDRLLGADREAPQDPEDVTFQREARVPWVQVPGEPDEAFSAFQRYLHAEGSPPIARFAREDSAPGRSTATIQGWAARYRWRDRRAAFAHMLAEDAATAARTAAESLAEAHARDMRAIREGLTASIYERQAAGEFAKMPVDRAIATAIKLVELERLIAGEATSRVAQVEDWSHLTDDEIAILQAAEDRRRAKG